MGALYGLNGETLAPEEGGKELLMARKDLPLITADFSEFDVADKFGHVYDRVRLHAGKGKKVTCKVAFNKDGFGSIPQMPDVVR